MIKQSVIHCIIINVALFRNISIMSLEERRSRNTTPDDPDLLESAASFKVEVKSEDEECDKISAGFVCPRCQAHFFYVDMFMEHVKQHRKEPECDKAQSAMTIESYQTSNTGDGPYKCGICSESFTRKSSLTSHNVVTHTGKKPHQCRTCSRAFARKFTLTEHLRTHTGETIQM